MIAVAQIGGHQAIVQEGEQIEVDKIDAKEGEKVEFDVLLISHEDGSEFQLGTPFLENTKIEAKILEHGRGKKVRVFKMKPRKRYRREKGHRQDYTVVEIVKIGTSTTKASAEKPEEKNTTPKTETTKEPAPKQDKTAEKKTTAKSTEKSAASKKVEKKEEDQ